MIWNDLGYRAGRKLNNQKKFMSRIKAIYGNDKKMPPEDPGGIRIKIVENRSEIRCYHTLHWLVCTMGCPDLQPKA